MIEVRIELRLEGPDDLEAIERQVWRSIALAPGESQSRVPVLLDGRQVGTVEIRECLRANDGYVPLQHLGTGTSGLRMEGEVNG